VIEMTVETDNRPFCGHIPARCAVCGADSPYVMWRVRGKHHLLFRSDGDERVVRCRRCGFVYLNPIPDPDVLLRSWADRPIFKDEISGTLAHAARGDVANITRFVRPGRLLEIGCGYGALLVEAQEAGFEVHGWEVNTNQCEYIRAELGVPNVFSEPLTDKAFPDRTFDVVAMLDVVEHIHNVHELLAEVRRILKDDGILYIDTPDFNGLRSRIRRRKWSYLTSVSHIYFFTLQSLDNLLRTEGMGVQARLIRRSPSPLRHLAKSLLSRINVYEELCVVARKL